VLSVTNLGAALYDVEFSVPVTVEIFGPEPDMLIYSSGNEGWDNVTETLQVNATTIRVLDGGANADGITFVMLGQPANLSASELFQIAIPSFPIP
jgi:hypothetical protein